MRPYRKIQVKLECCQSGSAADEVLSTKRLFDEINGQTVHSEVV